MLPPLSIGFFHKLLMLLNMPAILVSRNHYIIRQSLDHLDDLTFLFTCCSSSSCFRMTLLAWVLSSSLSSELDSLSPSTDMSSHIVSVASGGNSSNRAGTCI